MMNYNISVNERQKEVLLQNLHSQLSVINDKILKYTSESEDIKSLISQLNPNDSFLPSKINPVEQKVIQKDNYNINSSWYEKARHIIINHNHCITVGEIIDELITLGEGKGRKYIQKSLSATISQKIGKQLERYRLESGEYAIGLSEWFESSDNPKEEFIYKSKMNKV